MIAKLRQYWNQLDPNMRTWILGALHAGWMSATGAGIVWGAVGWKAALWTLGSAFITGVRLYRMQNPLPRQVWSDEERAARLASSPSASPSASAGTGGGK